MAVLRIFGNTKNQIETAKIMKLRKLASLTAITILSFTAIAACNNVNSDRSVSNKSTAAKVYNKNGVAIQGIDPVGYFKQSKVVKGNNSFTHEWNNATWKFASAENRDLFAANPEKYAPQYGGYCAWAVGQGNLVPIDPSAWKIVNEKLYLNYNKSVQKTWEEDIPGNIAKADRNWPGLLNK